MAHAGILHVIFTSFLPCSTASVTKSFPLPRGHLIWWHLNASFNLLLWRKSSFPLPVRFEWPDMGKMVQSPQSSHCSPPQARTCRLRTWAGLDCEERTECSRWPASSSGFCPCTAAKPWDWNMCGALGRMTSGLLNTIPSWQQDQHSQLWHLSHIPGRLQEEAAPPSYSAQPRSRHPQHRPAHSLLPDLTWKKFECCLHQETGTAQLQVRSPQHEISEAFHNRRLLKSSHKKHIYIAPQGWWRLPPIHLRMPIVTSQHC